jgi:ribosome-binding factor A
VNDLDLMPKNLPYDRAQRVADEIHHIIATICYTELSDPRLKGLEITAVKMTKDLEIARVYYHLREHVSEKRPQVQKGLESAAGYFKRAIAKELTLRVIPTIEFFYDETVDLAETIDQLMSKKDA